MEFNAFEDVAAERARVSSGVLSALHQQKSPRTTPSPVQVIDFQLNTWHPNSTILVIIHWAGVRIKAKWSATDETRNRFVV